MEEIGSKRRQVRDWIGEKVKDPTLRPFAVIAKSSDVCNYQCSYCYVEHNSSVPIMPLETAKIALEKIIGYIGGKRKINFIWHGGEPLMAGPEFFVKIVEFSEQFHDSNIEHCIQTNGSLLTDDFLIFCAEKAVTVSLSFDGPAEIHDMNRKDLNGKGTHYRTMQALQKIKKAGLTLGCVCVLHKQNVDRIAELYQFFSSNRINFRVNPVVRSGRAVNNYNALALTPVEYGLAMRRLFDLWFYDNGAIQVEPLHTIVGNYVGPSIWGCDYHGNCLKNIISINPDGTVYPCGRFAGLEKFRLGNITRNTLRSIFATPLFRTLSGRSAETIESCRDCIFSEVCNGGCMITAHMARGNVYDRDYYCQGRKILFAHIAQRLKQSLDKAAISI
jgi:uncharacterized protein